MNHSKHGQIFAHRGANKEVAENTKSAFDKALEYAIDGIETDVQLSRDEVAVLWHDRFLDKIGWPSKRTDDFDYDQLRSMDFAGYFAPGAKQEGVMSLKEFLDAYSQRCRLLIEIKNREWERSSRLKLKVRQTLDLIGPLFDGSIMTSSFNLASLIYAHWYAPECPLVYNLETDQTVGDAERALAAQPFLHGLCLPIETLGDSMVKLLRDHDKCIVIYTCNSDEEIGKALAHGVDIIISDYPQKALRLKAA